MKAKDWEFDKYIMDEEDFEAESKAINNVFGALEKSPISFDNESERDVFLFCAGFCRGMKWAIDKTKEAPPDEKPEEG